MGESLYDRLSNELSARASTQRRPGQVVAGSARLSALAERAGYRPPGLRAITDRLERIQRDILEPVEQQVERARRPAARKEELTRLLGEAGAELDALLCYATVEQVDALLRRRDALRFLLDKVPPCEVPDVLAAQREASAAVDAEVGRLRAWYELLGREQKVLKVEVEEYERAGVSSVVEERRFLTDLADLRRATAEAKENLQLAERPPARPLPGSLRRDSIETPQQLPPHLSRVGEPLPLGKF